MHKEYCFKNATIYINIKRLDQLKIRRATEIFLRNVVKERNERGDDLYNKRTFKRDCNAARRDS